MCLLGMLRGHKNVSLLSLWQQTVLWVTINETKKDWRNPVLLLSGWENLFYFEDGV